MKSIFISLFCSSRVQVLCSSLFIVFSLLECIERVEAKLYSLWFFLFFFPFFSAFSGIGCNWMNMSTVSLPVLSKQLQSVLIHDVRDAEGFLRAIGQYGAGLVKFFREDAVLELSFFSKGGVLHHIVKLAASLPNLLHKVPLLARGVRLQACFAMRSCVSFRRRIGSWAG